MAFVLQIETCILPEGTEKDGRRKLKLSHGE